MKEARKTAVVDRMSTARKARRAIREQRKRENRCLHCGGPLPDPREARKLKLEQKIAVLREEIRLLSLPPKPVPIDEDEPIAAGIRKR